MRILMRAALAAGVLVLAGSAAQADARYPYCAEGRGGNYGSGASNCSFTSFAQCEATAQGNGEWCHVNPAYSEREYDDAPQPAQRRRARRSNY